MKFQLFAFFIIIHFASYAQQSKISYSIPLGISIIDGVDSTLKQLKTFKFTPYKWEVPKLKDIDGSEANISFKEDFLMAFKANQFGTIDVVMFLINEESEDVIDLIKEEVLKLNDTKLWSFDPIDISYENVKNGFYLIVTSDEEECQIKIYRSHKVAKKYTK